MTFVDFLNWLSICLDCLMDLLSFHFFGLPLWLMLAGLFVSSWVVGFIVRGYVSNHALAQGPASFVSSFYRSYDYSVFPVGSVSGTSSGIASPERWTSSLPKHSDSVIVYDFEVE